MTTAPVYKDVERLLIPWVAGRHADARVCAETPGNLTDVVPCVVINGYGGGDTVPTLDKALFDVDVYGIDRGTARDLAITIRQELVWALPGTVLDGAVLGGTKTILAPMSTTYDNTSVRRVTASYQVTIHS